MTEPLPPVPQTPVEPKTALERIARLEQRVALLYKVMNDVHGDTWMGQQEQKDKALDEPAK